MKKNVKLMGDIAEDIWFSIFLHLSLTAICKLKCISKVWFSILSDPNFMNKWYELNHLSLPWAIATTSVADDDDADAEDNRLRKLFTFAFPDSHSQFVSQHQNGFSLEFMDLSNSSNNQGLTCVFLLGSSNGLVLCTTDVFNRSFYVCNPLTQKCVLLPPSPQSEEIWVATGFVCNESFSSSSYKVIRVPMFEAATKEFKVEIYSSDLGEWNVYDVSCPSDVTGVFCLFDNVVTLNGVMYWFQKKKNQILAISTVDRNNNHGTCGNECRLISMPDRGMGSDLKYRECIGESEGLICYAIVKKRERSLSVWVLKEDWYLLYKDNVFHDTLAEMALLIGGELSSASLTLIEVLGFNPVDKNVVILKYADYIWAYNTRTKGYEQLCEPSFLRNNGPCHLGVFTFTLKPRPTMLPPVSWRDT